MNIKEAVILEMAFCSISNQWIALIGIHSNLMRADGSKRLCVFFLPQMKLWRRWRAFVDALAMILCACACVCDREWYWRFRGNCNLNFGSNVFWVRGETKRVPRVRRLSAFLPPCRRDGWPCFGQTKNKKIQFWSRGKWSDFLCVQCTLTTRKLCATGREVERAQLLWNDKMSSNMNVINKTLWTNCFFRMLIMTRQSFKLRIAPPTAEEDLLPCQLFSACSISDWYRRPLRVPRFIDYCLRHRLVLLSRSDLASTSVTWPPIHGSREWPLTSFYQSYEFIYVSFEVVHIELGLYSWKSLSGGGCIGSTSPILDVLYF